MKPTLTLGEGRTRTHTLLLVVLIVLGTIPATAIAAGGDENSILLDTQHNMVGEATVQGQDYVIYHYKNALPYASGIVITKNGHTVRSATEAKTVIQAYAWQHESTRIGPSDIQTLTELNSKSETVSSIVSPSLQFCNEILSGINQLKQKSFMGTSIWDLAVRAYPALQQFEQSVRSLHDELLQWKTAVDEINRNVPPLVTELKQMRNGQDVDYASVSTHFSMVISGIGQLHDKTIAVRDTFRKASANTRDASTQVQSIPVEGSDLSNFFSKVASGFGQIASKFNNIASTLSTEQAKLTHVSSSAEAQQSQLFFQWQTRQKAQTKVYETLGGGGFTGVLLLGILILLRR